MEPTTIYGVGPRTKNSLPRTRSMQRQDSIGSEATMLQEELQAWIDNENGFDHLCGILELDQDITRQHVPLP